MNDRFLLIAGLAASQHSAVSLDQLERAGVNASLRHHWVAEGRLVRLGSRSFAPAGAAPTWRQSLVAAVFDLRGAGWVAGRTGARLHGLDGFTTDDVELIVPRALRNRCSGGTVRSTSRPISSADVCRVDGIPVLRAERLILEAPLFAFTAVEVENAIDAAIRLRLVSEQRLRTKVVRLHHGGINHGRALLDALVDTGGESRLERMFLRLVREAGLPRPVLQRTFRDGTRVVARVDACFPGGLVVELAGHGTHSTRRELQVDAQRHTELTLRGLRVLTFRYEDVRDRSTWVVARLREALRLVA